MVDSDNYTPVRSLTLFDALCPLNVTFGDRRFRTPRVYRVLRLSPSVLTVL